MAKKSDELVCVCMFVSRGTIEEAIRERNLSTVEEIGDVTEAGTNCGSCHTELEEILNEINKSSI